MKQKEEETRNIITKEKLNTREAYVAGFCPHKQFLELYD